MLFAKKRGCLQRHCIEWFGWLAGLALWPVLGFGQVFIKYPQNQTVCVGEKAVFTCETDGGITGWLFNNTLYQDFPEEYLDDIEREHTNTPNFTRIDMVTLTYNQAFNGLTVVLEVVAGRTFDASNPAYIFYQTNHQSPVTGLIGAVNNGTAAQIYWNAHNSNFTTQYLFGVYDGNNLIANQTTDSTHISYDLPDSACYRLILKVTANQCPDPASGFIQTEGATIDYIRPDISPVTAEFDNYQTVLVSWTPDGGNAFQIVVTDLVSGNQTAYNSTQPFSYMAAGCGQFNLNVSVSPAECPDQPGITQSETIRFTIPCPTTATEATETETETSGTQAIVPSSLPIIAATVMLLKHYYEEVR